MSFGKNTTAEQVASLLNEEIRGKNVIITGVSSGSLGAEVIRTLAPYANLIVAAGRNQNKIDETIAAVKKETPAANIRGLILDLHSLESVRAAAKEVNAYSEVIHVLINNAATPQTKERATTKEGFESQFGGNHLAHFLFTNLILPRIKLAATPSYSPRIVNVTSSAHATPAGEIRWDDPNFEKRPNEYSKYGAYSQTKTSELAKRLAKDNILSYAPHPGIIFTLWSTTAPSEDFVTLGLKDANGVAIQPERFKNIHGGASTHIVAAFDPSIKDQSGAYLTDAQVHNELRASWASSEESAARLWTLTEELLGESFSP